MNEPRIYLDHAATTPLRPEARFAMLPYLEAGHAGNASSLHASGQRAKRTLDTARDILAHALGASFSEVCFVSGGTEGDNAALVGIMLANKARGNHLIVSQVEHEAVLNTAAFLETIGFEVTRLAPDTDGLISPTQLGEAITPRTVLVSIMHANNEVGTLQPIAEMAEIAHRNGALFHTDAVQTFGQMPVTVESLGADLITVSAHKIGGPVGAGALFVRDGLSIEPLMHGGGQERGRRAGTENIAAIAGFAAAVTQMLGEREADSQRLTSLRDSFIRSLQTQIPGAVLNGHRERRLPNNINISLPGIDSEAALLRLDRVGISASAGSACTSGSIEPSHVLLAMGLEPWRVHNALRLTLGRETTEAELTRTLRLIALMCNHGSPVNNTPARSVINSAF